MERRLNRLATIYRRRMRPMHDAAWAGFDPTRLTSHQLFELDDLLALLERGQSVHGRDPIDLGALTDDQLDRLTELVAMGRQS
jgi:hypothetical protein